MIVSMSKFFNEAFRKRFKAFGFIKCKQVFARFNEDIIQAFALKEIRGGRYCTIEFGIFPIYLPYTVCLEAGGYELHHCLPKLRSKGWGWEYDPHSEVSMRACMLQILETAEQYMLPFFESSRCSDAAFSEAISLEEKLEECRLESLELMGEPDCAIPYAERSMFDSRKYYLALKTNNWDYAKRYLTVQIAYHEEKLRSFDNPGSQQQPIIVKERFKKQISFLTEHLSQLESGNAVFFEMLLQGNETRQLKFLETKYPALYKVISK